MIASPRREPAALAAERDGIPVLDLGSGLAGAADARARLAPRLAPGSAPGLRHALEAVGCVFHVNHPIAQSRIDRVFAEAARFHALRRADQTALAFSPANIG